MKGSKQNTPSEKLLEHLLTDCNGNPLKGAARDKRIIKIQRENLDDLHFMLAKLQQEVEQSKLEVLQITPKDQNPDEDLVYLVAAQEERITELESQLKARTNIAGNVQRMTKILLSGSLMASVCGTVVLLLHPTATELGIGFGFVAGISGSAIVSIEEQEYLKRRKSLF